MVPKQRKPRILCGSSRGQTRYVNEWPHSIGLTQGTRQGIRVLCSALAPPGLHVKECRAALVMFEAS